MQKMALVLSVKIVFSEFEEEKKSSCASVRGFDDQNCIIEDEIVVKKRSRLKKKQFFCIKKMRMCTPVLFPWPMAFFLGLIE